MRNQIALFLATAGVAGFLAAAAAQDNNEGPPPPAPETVETPAVTNAPPPPDDNGGKPRPAATAAPVGQTAATGNLPAPDKAAGSGTNAPVAAETAPAQFVPPALASGTNNPDELRLNFRNAPLEMVLNYLSDAAGFIIVLETPVHGNVSVISSQPLTRDEAVDLLNAVLNKSGYAAIRDGRTLTIVDKDAAKTRDIPVKISNDPGAIPKNDEVVTEIIPIRYVEATQLVKDLAAFVSAQATIVANEAGNSIVITDTQANIHHLVEIVKAIDSSAEGETQIRVFHLVHANPADVANELTQMFPSNTGSSGNTQSPIRFGGGGGGGGPGGFFQRMMAANGGGGGAGAGGSQNARVQKQSQVLAVADARTSSVIVTASKDLMEEIAGMMAQLDVGSTRDQKVYVFHMENGDPQQAAQVLQNMFQTTTSSRGSSSSASSSQTSALMQREQNNSSSSSTSVSGSSSTSGGFGSSSRSGGGGQLP